MTYSDNIEKLRQAGVIDNPLIGNVLEHIDEWALENNQYNWNKNSIFVDVVCDVCSLWEHKDLPLDDQENREEIAEFLVSLIK